MIGFKNAEEIVEDGFRYLVTDKDFFWVITPQRQVKFQKTFDIVARNDKGEVVEINAKFVSTKIDPELAQQIAKSVKEIVDCDEDDVIVQKFYKKAVVKLIMVEEDGKYWL